MSKPIEEQIVDVMKDFRMRRLRFFVDHPEAVTDEELIPVEVCRLAEARAIWGLVHADLKTTWDATHSTADREG